MTEVKYAHSLLTSPLDGNKWLAPRPSRFTLNEGLKLIAGSDVAAKKVIPATAVYRTMVAQPIPILASRGISIPV
jgi:hypothetical protein